MKDHATLYGVLVAAAISGSLLAQSPDRRSSATPQKNTTVIGCLRQAGGAAATPDAPGLSSTGVPGVPTTPAVGQFLLVDAQESTAPESVSGTAGARRSSAPGGAGPSGSPDGVRETTSYRLQGHASDLRKLVGRQVEVVGQLVPAATGAVAQAAPSRDTREDATGDAIGGTERTGLLPRIAVESVRMIAPACSR
ncbi:MAG: hypothetical protein AB7O32_14910 [Vicinamibacterales bacterium]